MTDKDIIKALECCRDKIFKGCDNCPMDEDNDCIEIVCANAVGLINLQQAEIERLKQEQVFAKAHYGELEWQHITLCEALKTAKAEAIKEFVMKLKIYILNPNKDFYAMLDEIDNLVKEMEERNERTSFGSSC